MPPRLQFLPGCPGEQASLREFLMAVFRSAPDAWYLAPELLGWKYYQARPDWDGIRSYVVKDGETMVGHGCVHPVTLVTAVGEVSGTRVIDWAASPGAPGSGVLVFRKLASAVDVLLDVGGSAETRAILPKMGFRHVADMEMFARVVRPWRQFRSYPWRGGAKGLLRLGRNLAWSREPLPEAPPGWSAERVERFEAAAFPSYHAHSAFTAAKRTPELLNYMLRCPGAAVSGFLLKRGGTARGHFVLSRPGGQTRIADLGLDSGEPEDWRAAFALATRAAAADPATCEILAVATVPLLGDAIRRAGFRSRWREPLLVWDPKKRLAGAPPLSIQLLDGDEFYSNDPRNPYLTY